MGWESAITTALSLAGNFMKSSETNSNARQQANSIIEEGNINARNKAREIAAKAGTQRVSFLNSGIALEGTPMNVIDQTFTTGLEDIHRIESNYNTKAKGVISQARSSMLESLASGFGGFGIPGGGDSGYSLSDIGSGINSFASGTGFGAGAEVAKTVRLRTDIF